ncbi:MAG: DUF4244 domain-containing protein [bacterium]|nr:DUF4244 domain-containing protein [bacterium]
MSIQRFNHRVSSALAVRMQKLAERREAGMVSAEYAVGILAAIAFALLLMGILKSSTIRGIIMNVISAAFSIG